METFKFQPRSVPKNFSDNYSESSRGRFDNNFFIMKPETPFPINPERIAGVKTGASIDYVPINVSETPYSSSSVKSSTTMSSFRSPDKILKNSIPGYSGFVPGYYVEDNLGNTFSKAKTQAEDILRKRHEVERAERNLYKEYLKRSQNDPRCPVAPPQIVIDSVSSHSGSRLTHSSKHQQQHLVDAGSSCVSGSVRSGSTTTKMSSSSVSTTVKMSQSQQRNESRHRDVQFSPSAIGDSTPNGSRLRHIHASQHELYHAYNKDGETVGGKTSDANYYLNKNKVRKDARHEIHSESGISHYTPSEYSNQNYRPSPSILAGMKASAAMPGYSGYRPRIISDQEDAGRYSRSKGWFGDAIHNNDAQSNSSHNQRIW